MSVSERKIDRKKILNSTQTRHRFDLIGCTLMSFLLFSAIFFIIQLIGHVYVYNVQVAMTVSVLSRVYHVLRNYFSDLVDWCDFSYDFMYTIF